MDIKFLGAAGEVTGSCYCIQNGSTRFLVDCGMFQGSADADDKNEAPWPFDPSSIEFVFLTHAHFDHCGRLPKLYHDGFRGKIFTTAQTSELANLILSDAADLMFHQSKDRGKKPLYTLNEVKALNGLYHPMTYGKPITLGGGFTVTFHDAGHVLGSAIVEIKIDGKTIVFSGDLGNHPVPFLNPPEQIAEADILMVESTYGGRLHEHQDRRAALKQVIIDAAEKKGTLLVPAFALERTQEILYYINDLRDKNEIPDIPIYVDAPLAIEITAVFRRNEFIFDDADKNRLRAGDDFFDFPHLKYCTTTEESKALEFVPSPKVIIAGSGMMNGGRILHHLQHYGPYQNTIIAVVGYQVPGTLGRRLLDGEHLVHIYGEEIGIHAEIRDVTAFSAHADKIQLAEWIAGFKRLDRVYVIHGEEEEAKALSEAIGQEKPNAKVSIPVLFESVEI